VVGRDGPEGKEEEAYGKYWEAIHRLAAYVAEHHPEEHGPILRKSASGMRKMLMYSAARRLGEEKPQAGVCDRLPRCGRNRRVFGRRRG
jgi:hypothetical protein